MKCSQGLNGTRATWDVPRPSWRCSWLVQERPMPYQVTLHN